MVVPYPEITNPIRHTNLQRRFCIRCASPEAVLLHFSFHFRVKRAMGL
ncbi:hypothetical protein EDO6_01947 [Paenibacillus xylanexedens]|nr:hypothetical protein EDO6_01947 [Paenibacillus xylanexedens]